MAMVFTPMGPMDENDPRIQQFGWVKDAGGSYVAAPQGGTTPPPSGPAAAATQYASPEAAYQATGIAGYGKTFQELQQASHDRNQGLIDQMSAYDQSILNSPGGLDLNSGIWQGMDDYSLTGALGALGNGGMGGQLRNALLKKYGSGNALNNMINKYWAGFIDDPKNHQNFNQDFWQKLGTWDYMKAHPEYAGPKPQYLQDFDPTEALKNPYGNLSEGGSFFKGTNPWTKDFSKGNPYTTPQNTPTNTPQNPPGPGVGPLTTGTEKPWWEMNKRVIGGNPMGSDPQQVGMFQPFNAGRTNNMAQTNNFQLNPNQFKLPGQ